VYNLLEKNGVSTDQTGVNNTLFGCYETKWTKKGYHNTIGFVKHCTHGCVPGLGIDPVHLQFPVCNASAAISHCELETSEWLLYDVPPSYHGHGAPSDCRKNEHSLGKWGKPCKEVDGKVECG
jgi:hypothetical protein